MTTSGISTGRKEIVTPSLFCHQRKEAFLMSAKNGKPCKRCGAREWNKWGQCIKCKCEYARQWQKANPEKVSENSRRWQQGKPGWRSEKSRLWYKDNPDKHVAQYHRRRTRKTEAGGSYTAEEWKSLCKHYGNQCLCCGRGDAKLTADHIRPVSRGGSSNIENIQPLCKSCNSAKGNKHIDYRPDAGIARWLQAKLFG